MRRFNGKCPVLVTAYDKMDTELSSPLPEVSPTDDRQSELPLSNCILMLFESQILTDVTFRCKDQDMEDLNEGIHAHKNILAARSPVFRAMFSGSYTDGEKEIYLSDTESKDFKVFLRSIYSDELPSEVENLVQVVKIALAHKYQTSYVVDSCFTELSENLTKENACSLLDLALFYGNEELTTSACRFIDENSEDVLQSDGFLEISLQCLTYILKGDTFFTDETKIFERSMEWAEKRCDSSEGSILRTTLGEAFFYLRTPSMTVKEFISCTKRKGYYTLTETEDIMEAIANNDDSECDNVLCNSSTTRVPPQIDVQISGRQHSVSQYTYVSQATTVLTLVPKIDIILTSIQLSDLRKGGLKNPYPQFGQTHQKCNADGRQIKATITIKEIGIFQEYMVTAEKNHVSIILESPIFLECSGDKYVIRIELKPINMSFIEFEVLPLYEDSLKDVTDDSGTITVRCHSKSRYQSIVDSMTFENLSYRED